MKNILLIIIVIIQTLPCYGKHSNTLIYNGNEKLRITLSNSVSSEDLYYQSSEFSDVARLGNQLSKKCKASPVDETCVFEGLGLRITYINLNGQFELSEIVLSEPFSSILLNDERIPIGIESKAYLNKNDKSSIIKAFRDGSMLSPKEKFNGTYSYLEIVKNNDQEIEKIIYERSLL